jgi:RNA polymerase sigma-70 factor, ECF subfamily
MREFKQELLPLIPNLRSYACALSRNRDWADDLVQETILRAWTNRARYQPESNMKAWLFTILRNHFYNELRQKKRSVELSNDVASRTASMRENQSNSLHLRDVARAFADLSNEQREALVLVSIDGLSYEESARICNCAIGTVKSRVARARGALDAKLGGSSAGSSPAIYAKSAAVASD